MNSIREAMLIAALIGFTGATTYGQETVTRSMTVSFDNPERPGIVKIASGQGDISVTGYSGKEVRIKATVSDKNVLPPEDDEKAKGLKRIAGSGFNVSTDRDENAVVITRPMDGKVALEIQAPLNTSLKIGNMVKDISIGGHSLVLPTPPPAPGAGDHIQLKEADRLKLERQLKIISGRGFSGGVFEGNITVENISGEMEISTLDGNITLKNVSGPVVTSAVDGNITAVFRMVSENRPMAFSTVDGDIDVTLPERIKATITANNLTGNVYTDFDMEIAPGSSKSSAGELKIYSSTFGRVGSTVTGKINGGGIDIQMKAIDGGIYIRKGK